MPQNVKEEGGYKIKGKTLEERTALREDAAALADAGAFAVVLELVNPKVAGELTTSLPIPTIGIGSGMDCDGQILVTNDLWATSPDFIPNHVQSNEAIRAEMQNTVQLWKDSIG